jgi:hypothetical protein
MPRSDLLALTHDDLSALTNRGTVKRAQREIDSGEVGCEITESDAGEVAVKWTDDAKCVFPAGGTVAQGRCSCVATTLCRHLVRSVLAYQKKSAESAGPTPPPALAPWDPGTISDEELAKHFKKPALAAAAAKLKEGLLIELVRSSKPTARFHQLACTLRFVVPGDIRYTHCDCAEVAPCSHVPLAVQAVRLLGADKNARVVSTQQTALPVPAELLVDVEAARRDLVDDGISNAPTAWKDRMVRLERRCQEAELVWPAEVLAEIVQQYERYAGHNALFAPDRIAELAGEALIRSDAIRSAPAAVPQLLVRGTSADRATNIGSARYIGLGCGARQQRGSAEVTAYLQDADTGTVVTVSREFPDPDKESKAAPRDFWQLAQTPVVRGISLGAMGGGQLLIQGGKRSPDRRLTVGRAKASLNPQGFAWESLRAPVLAESFAELRARLGGLPPASLRPRYVAEDFHVCPVAAVEGPGFNAISQTVEAVVTDAAGESARIVHPFQSRSREGTEALLAAFADPLKKLRFVAGPTHLSSRGIVCRPVMLVFECGPSRVGLQPSIDRLSNSASSSLTAGAAAASTDSAQELPAELLAHLGEVFLLGLRRADARVARVWQELARHAEALGYDRLARPIAALAESLRQKASTSRWDSGPAIQIVLELALLARLAQDVAG